MATIQGIKLVTGEELVAEVTSADAHQVHVKDPLVLVTQNTRDGVVVNFYPWTIIAEGNIPLRVSAIVARYPVPKEVEDNYITNTTGLQIVSSSPAPQILQG